MRELQLSPRLAAVAGYLTDSRGIVDVGTDHGYLPVWAARELPSARLIATDIHEGPLARARRFARDSGAEDRIEFKLCDGLDGIGPEDCDTIVVAGMGGENIAGILERAAWAPDGRHRLVLQPMSRAELMLKRLGECGCAVTGGRLVRDGGRLYHIITACGGVGEALTPGQLYAGPWLFKARDPLLPEYLDAVIKKLSRVDTALRSSGREPPEELSVALTELKKWRKINGYG